jgi:hypothetical protein
LPIERLAFFVRNLEQIAFETPAPALTAQVNCAYAYAAAGHPYAWPAEHFQKQNALTPAFVYADSLFLFYYPMYCQSLDQSKTTSFPQPKFCSIS